MADVNSEITTALATAIAGIAAIGGLGAAASGLVDASKLFAGGISNAGFGYIRKALKPFKAALDGADSDWQDTIRANWINGIAKEDQKATAKSLIRLGLSSNNAQAMAAAGHVDPVALQAVLAAIETGAPLTPNQINILGRFNGAIDAAMDAGFERADQLYRNAAKFCSGLTAIALAIWAGYLLKASPSNGGLSFWDYVHDASFGKAFLVGLIAVPLGPVAKDLTSALQAAAGAVHTVKS